MGSIPMDNTGNKISLIYDSQCEFCRRSVEWLSSRDDKKILRFVPCKSEERMKEFLEITEEECMSGVQVITSEKQKISGFDGIAYVMRFLRGTKLLGTMLGLPMVRIVGKRVYSWVARNRNRITCKNNTCHL